ncbi:MAG: filamentous hemagglutinin N-terminal domain-containing protein [Desulfovibrionaceae bacterium]|nr:filamentous hemagglutinin N-terminal domain-containing protein [Desulfovibrionaceae bacterium]
MINWRSFDIAKSESVTHSMPNSSSAALHRVTGCGGASQISGIFDRFRG